MLIVANAWAIDSPNCAGPRHLRYESVFTHSGPKAVLHNQLLSAKIARKRLTTQGAGIALEPSAKTALQA